MRELLECCEKVEKKMVKKSTTLLHLQTIVDMCVLVCSYTTSQKLDVTVRNRSPHDHGFAFQAQDHGLKKSQTSLSCLQDYRGAGSCRKSPLDGATDSTRP